MKLLDSLTEYRRPKCTAIVVAAGTASRMGGIDKIMADLNGKPVIIHTLLAFQKARCIDEIVVVARPEREAQLKELVEAYQITKTAAVVPGGLSRMESVMAGLKAAGKKSTLVAIQDGARPMVSDEIIEATVAAGIRSRAAAPGIPVKDTVKVVGTDGKVVSTPDRSTLRAVQTPQVFDRDLLVAAWKLAEQEGKSYTDDCGAMEGMGMRVYLTEGSEENLKITTPFDLKLAELIMKGREG